MRNLLRGYNIKRYKYDKTYLVMHKKVMYNQLIVCNSTVVTEAWGELVRLD